MNKALYRTTPIGRLHRLRRAFPATCNFLADVTRFPRWLLYKLFCGYNNALTRFLYKTAPKEGPSSLITKIAKSNVDEVQESFDILVFSPLYNNLELIKHCWEEGTLRWSMTFLFSLLFVVSLTASMIYGITIIFIHVCAIIIGVSLFLFAWFWPFILLCWLRYLWNRN